MSQSMENEEFNLSILENAMSPNTPKDCSSIVSMIKEEIDIKTEDEMDNPKSLKSPRISANRKELDSYDLENLFKSPLKQNTGKYKSAGRLLTPRTKQNLQKFATNITNGRATRGYGSLGAIKSGRSSNSSGRRKRSSLSQSSQDETSGFSDSTDTIINESPKKIVENNVKTDETMKNIIEVDVATSTQAQIIVHASQDQEDSPKTLSSNSTSKNENLVENTEISESSEGTKRLQNIEKIGETKKVDNEKKNDKETEKEIEKINAVTSEEKLDDSSAKITTKLVNSCQETKKDDEIVQPSSKKRKISVSPLKGLTQEMKNSSNLENDYIAMCDATDDDMVETMSFTFETIELLNEYEDENQLANNQLLSKILSSPIKKIKEEPSTIENIDPLIPWDPNESMEDPLYIDNATKEKLSAMRKKSKENVSKLSNIISDAEETIKVTRRRSSSRFSNLNEEEIINEIIPTTEDKVLVEKVEEIKKIVENVTEKSAIKQKTLDRLENLRIQLRHKVLPQHRIEKHAGSTPLSQEEQTEFMKYAPLRKRVYHPSEDNIIKKNWAAFCKLHKWNPKNVEPFRHLRLADKFIMPELKQRRKFVQFLADGLPSRPLFSVYNRFKILFSNHADTGSRYTREEDLKILAYIRHNSSESQENKYSELAKALNRSRISIWRRYKKLIEKTSPKKEKNVATKIEWNLVLVTNLISTLLDVTLSEELIDLKDAFIPKVVWLKVEEKMQIHHEVLKRFWEQQLHLQLFSPQCVYLKEIKIKLIEYMYIRNFHHPKDINWNNVVKFFDGATTTFLRKTFNNLTTKIPVTEQKRSLRVIVKWLYQKTIKILKNDPKDKCLPRICYVNGNAELVIEDVEKIPFSAPKLDFDSLF